MRRRRPLQRGTILEALYPAKKYVKHLTIQIQLIAAIAGSLSAAAEANQVDPAELIRAALKKNMLGVVISPGVYRPPPDITIAKAKDLKVVADGVAIILPASTAESPSTTQRT